MCNMRNNLDVLLAVCCGDVAVAEAEGGKQLWETTLLHRSLYIL